MSTNQANSAFHPLYKYFSFSFPFSFLWSLLHESRDEVVNVAHSRAVDHLLSVDTSMTVALIFTKIGNFVLKLYIYSYL